LLFGGYALAERLFALQPPAAELSH
jgi:hypothetical protein